MTRKQFNEWVGKMVKRYKIEQLSNDYEMRTIKNVIICVDRNHKVGIAKCHPDDKFNIFIGMAIAYARMRGLEVPKVTNYKRLSEMVNGDRFIYRKKTVLHFIGKYPFLKDMYVMLDNSGTTYVLADEEFEMVD